MNTKPENRLASKYNILKSSLDAPKYYSLNTDQDWVRELLVELNEKAEEKTPEQYLERTFLTVNLEIIKKSDPPHGDYLIVKGSFEAVYMTQCVRTLQDMPETLSVEFKACLLHINFENDEKYIDQPDLFIDEDMHDLYFFDKNFAEIKELVHDYIYLNLNQYPVKDEQSPLDGAIDPSMPKQ